MSYSNHFYDDDSDDDDQTKRLISGTLRLELGKESLYRATRLAADTEDIGISTINTVSTQNDQLRRIDNQISDVDESLSRGKRVMRAISRRIITNKLIKMCTILICLTLIGTIIYLIYFDNQTNSKHHSAKPKQMKRDLLSYQSYDYNETPQITSIFNDEQTEIETIVNYYKLLLLLE